MKVGIFTRYNDTDNIIEFMKYHYSIGINYILIYNDGSSNKLDECKKHFSKKMFKIVYFKWINKNDIHTLNYSRQFYKNILNILRRKNVDYCFHIDNDEYIVLQETHDHNNNNHIHKNHKNHNNNLHKNHIHNLVKHYQPFDQLYLNWIFFGDNNIYDASNLSTLLDKNNKSEIFVSSNEPKVLVNVKTAISASSPHFFDRFNKDRNSIINKNVFNESGVPLTNRYIPSENNIPPVHIPPVHIPPVHIPPVHRPPVYIAHFSIITLKDFYNKRFNHISGSRLAKPNFSNINFKKAIKKNYILIYLLTILKIKKEDFINMTITNPTTLSILEPFYTMIDLYFKRNKNDSINTTFNNFINDNPELYANSQKTRIINITKNIIIKMINKINITITTLASTDPYIIILKPEAIKTILNIVNNSTIDEIIKHGVYVPEYDLRHCQ
jgi:hypothetical protein